ncbi:MAG: prolyl hydroxylase family protein [Hyphomonadaceae bacterium]
MDDLNALQAKAAAGDSGAQYALGVRLIAARGAPFAPKQGAALVDAAAAQDHTGALQLAAVLAALGFERSRDWSVAMALIERAAERGDIAARAQLAVLGPQFDIAAFCAPPALTPLQERPRIAAIAQFLPPAFCDWMIGRARPVLDAAKVYDPVQGGMRHGERRTNTGTGFGPADTDLVMQAIHARIAASIGLPLEQQEATNVLHYEPGQQFLPHFDSLDPKVPHFAGDLARNGQRLLTFLVYLNDDFEGGETEFPCIDWRYRGAKGDALVFWNVGGDGLPDEQALHAGLAPTRGEKWLLSKWVRDRALPLI